MALTSEQRATLRSWKCVQKSKGTVSKRRLGGARQNRRQGGARVNHRSPLCRQSNELYQIVNMSIVRPRIVARCVYHKLKFGRIGDAVRREETVTGFVRFAELDVSVAHLRCYDFPPRISGHLFASLPRLQAILLASCFATCAPSRSEGTSGPGPLFNRRPDLLVRSHVDVSGTSQVPKRSILCLCPALRPRPNRRSLASLTVSSLPPRFPRQELQRLMNFGALSRGFGTCCLRFKTGVATTPARLASGWLARLYREGVEPSGSLQKVSDRSLILLFWIYPGAREVSSSPLRLRVHSITSSARARSVGGISRPSALAVLRLTISSNLVG